MVRSSIPVLSKSTWGLSGDMKYLGRVGELNFRIGQRGLPYVRFGLSEFTDLNQSNQKDYYPGHG